MSKRHLATAAVIVLLAGVFFLVFQSIRPAKKPSSRDVASESAPDVVHDHAAHGGNQQTIDVGSSSPQGGRSQGIPPQPSRSPASVRSFSLEDFKRQFPGDWDLSRLPDGTPEMLVGGKIKVDGTDPRTALELARRMAPHFGISAESVDLSRPEPIKTPTRIGYHFEQTHQSLPVHHGRLALFVQVSNNEVSLVNNSLKQITATEPGPSLSSTRAADEFEASSVSEEKVVGVNGPVYFIDHGTARPAYVATVRVPGSPGDHLVVIDGNTGRSLERLPTINF